MAYVLLGCQVLVAVVFAAAVAGKRSGEAFAEFTASTGRLLPPRLAGWRQPAARAVFAAELAVPVLVAVPATAVAGFTLSLVLLTAFTAGIAGALRRGERAPCRCFGSSATRLGPADLVRDLFLIVVALTGVMAALLVPAGRAWPASPATAALTAVAALAGAALVIRLDDLIALFAPTSMSSK
ncbi:MauE/DoxX family redox-associated membrane protein [Planomonospora parontospora]|uniref:MauE/DoxX family redox-associated membrane protein n=1 Tax=Planomonospora parontospora TaxID=58119 RepID=UPI00167115CB|nr:MauE/DoxX family redox-associated membrane protein [Planomonospora parontospora]GGL03619.1 methylamine utilization protein MauE [Planomonospora parontospora subsp. antibiotica]GII13378.1 methylamine utilization protein MauE [Planomonospora parontospora subsp. antibiotica]